MNKIYSNSLTCESLMTGTQGTAINLVATNINTYPFNSNFAFDKVTTQCGSLSYNTQDKTIIVGEDGIYYMSWYLNIQRSDEFYTAFVARNQNNVNLCSCGISFGSPDVGVYFITFFSNQLFMAKANDIIRLQNISADEVNLFMLDGQSGNLSMALMSKGGS